ncbi:MAG: universal stress protein, partial [Comamonas sp.]
VKYAQEGQYDLIVMGTHGHSALGRLVMGSVSSQVLAGCTIPVLLIR